MAGAGYNPAADALKKAKEEPSLGSIFSAGNSVAYNVGKDAMNFAAGQVVGNGSANGRIGGAPAPAGINTSGLAWPNPASAGLRPKPVAHALVAPVKPVVAAPTPNYSRTWKADRSLLSPAWQTHADSLPFSGTYTDTGRASRPAGAAHGATNSNGFDWVPKNWADIDAAGKWAAERGLVALDARGAPGGDHVHFAMAEPDKGRAAGYYRPNVRGDESGAWTLLHPGAAGQLATGGVPAQVGSAGTNTAAAMLRPDFIAQTVLPVPAVDTNAVTSAAAYTPGAPAQVIAPVSNDPAGAPRFISPPMANSRANAPSLEDIATDIKSGAGQLVQGGNGAMIGRGLGKLGSAVGANLSDIVSDVPSYLQSGAQSVRDFAGRLVRSDRGLGGQSPLSLLATGLSLMDSKASVSDAMKAGQEALALGQAPDKFASDQATAAQTRGHMAAETTKALESPRQFKVQAALDAAKSRLAAQTDERKTAQTINAQGEANALNAQVSAWTAMMNGTTSTTNASIAANAREATAGAGSGRGGKVSASSPLVQALQDLGHLPSKTDADIASSSEVVLNAIPKAAFQPLWTSAWHNAQRLNPDAKLPELKAAAWRLLLGTINGSHRTTAPPPGLDLPQ